MITYIFRKRAVGMFSVEKVFETLYSQFERTGTELCRLDLPYVSKGLLSVLYNMLYAARRRRSQVLHITGDVHYAALLCPSARTIITVHDCVALQRGTGFKRWVMWMLWFGLPMRRATAVTVISEQTKKELMQVVGVSETKITVIPNFVDPAFVYSERPPVIGPPRILHVGVTPNKNLPSVVEALRGMPCVLVIVGRLGPDVLASLEQSGIHYENHVDVDHATMIRLYRDADIISFPSTYEGFGLPILEGQATGRPVLTSDLEPMRSVAGPKGALLVDPRSVTSIREGFLRLIADGDLRAELVAAGRDNCRGYTLEAVAARYSALYGNV
jgi:glycosyltransferase involved in cell wall biosynthesis